MSLTVLEEPIKFHLSLNVSDLKRSVAFYYQLFGVQPAKWHDDYAKFELEEPPVIFSLVPHWTGSGGVLSHIGIRVADDEALQAVRERIEAAGLDVEEQCGTVCGHARQNKCWITDPDGNFWEIYCIEEDIGPPPSRNGRPDSSLKVGATSGPIAWEHYVSQALPKRIPHEDSSVDEVRLTGTFNADIDDAARQRLIGEAVRVLKPGGKVVTHGLMGDRSLPAGNLNLPGLATLVKRVPALAEPMEMFRAAGLGGLQIVKYTEQPWFVHDGVELREVKIIATKLESSGGDVVHRVIYKGPFSQAKAAGRVFARGERVDLPEPVWRELRSGVTADCFVFLEPASAGTGCSVS